MLTREIMGAVALAALWVNVLLIAAATAKQALALLSLRSGLKTVARGRVVRGDGPGGAFAVHRVAQVGRAADDARSIFFHDRSAVGELFGGALELDGTEREIAASERADVWLTDPHAMEERVSPDAFEAASKLAAKAKGYERTFEGVVPRGASVFVAESTSGASLVTNADPRPVLVRKAALGAVFIAGDLTLAAACSALALASPWFGPWSTLGGALCLGFFLAVQPVGVLVRDAMRVPSLAPVRGRWVRPVGG
jgi:hypothetical protein